MLLMNLYQYFNKNFNKNLLGDEEKEKQFQLSNMCWIYEKLIDDDDEKVRDHFYITRKFRGAAHLTCIFSYLKKFL